MKIKYPIISFLFFMNINLVAQSANNCYEFISNGVKGNELHGHKNWPKIKDWKTLLMNDYVPPIKKGDTIVFIRYTSEDLTKAYKEQYIYTMLKLGLDSSKIDTRNIKYEDNVYVTKNQDQFKRNILKNIPGIVLIEVSTQTNNTSHLIIKQSLNVLGNSPDTCWGIWCYYFKDNRNGKCYPWFFTINEKIWKTFVFSE